MSHLISHRNPELILHKRSFRNNISYLKSKTSSSFFCPMVKANAYGVGDILVVRELLDLGVKALGVARPEEGMKLRRYFPEKDFQILVFNPVFEEQVSSYEKSFLTPVIASFRELKVYLSSGLSVPVHLKFDLGMNRFGFNFNDARELAQIVSEAQIKVEALCGHFSQGDDWGEAASVSKKQFENFKVTQKEYFPTVLDMHIPNSDAILSGEASDLGLRPGLSMYYSGAAGDAEGVGAVGSKLKNVLSLNAPILEIRDINPGEGVSYQSIWKATEKTQIAILPIGYADGLRRPLSNRISLSYENKDFPLVGAICMDYCMADIGLSSGLKIGDRLEFFGKEMANIAQWSEILQTIPYEILTGLGPRIHRSIR